MNPISADRPERSQSPVLSNRAGSATVLKLLLAALGALLGLLGIGSVGGHHAAPSAVASAVLPPPPPANDTTFYLGPVQRNGATGSGNVYVDQLSIPTVAGRIYKLRIQNGTAGGANRVTSAVTKWNGYVVVEAGELTSSTAEVTEILSATPTDTLSMTVVGPAGSYVTVSVFSVTSPEFVIFGQNTYNIPSGTTKTYTPSFTKPATAAATYRMLVINGDSLGANRVTTGQIKLNGTTVFPTTELTSAKGSLSKNVTVTAGSNSLNIVLNGSTGKFIKLRITATDTTDPGVTITTPVASSFTNQTTVSVTGTLSDETITTVTVNGVDATVTGNTSYANTASLSSEGSNLLTVIATDGNANATTVTRTITRDTQAPTLTVAHPLDSTFTKNASVTVDGTVSDATVATVNTNGTPWTVSAGNYSGSFSLAYGNNTLVTTATDQASNATAIARFVVWDTLPPSLTVSAPTNGTTIHADSVQVTGTVSDPSPVTVTANGVSLAITAGVFNGKVAVAPGANSISVVATDRATNATTIARSLTWDVPVEPSTVAPALSSGITTTVLDATSFLYTGGNPIQSGVTPGTIELTEAAAIRGYVTDTAGSALSGARVAVLDHPELGYTFSRDSGGYDLAVNAGRKITLTYAKPGYLPAQRTVDLTWGEWRTVDTLALVPLTTRSNSIDFSTAIQVAKGDSVHDTTGTRQPVLMFRQGTTASATLPNGTTQQLSTPITVRATEYTVGPRGPVRMPGPLPEGTAYTYAAELSVDQAEALNAISVQFSQPFAFYLDNFMGYPVGFAVPYGTYDRVHAKWIPDQDGRVIKILGVTSGKADLQVDTVTGNIADSAALAALGITDAERTQVATSYAVGKVLWRMQLTHFSPGDANGGVAIDSSANAPAGLKDVKNDLLDKGCETSHSIVGCDNQTLGEVLSITGTPYTLHYQSDRTLGYTAGSTLDLQLTGDTVPAAVAAARGRVWVAGRLYERIVAPTPNQRWHFSWDGNDLFGRRLQGPQIATVERCYAYPYVSYAVLPGASGGGGGSFGMRAVQVFTGGQIIFVNGRQVYTNQKLCKTEKIRIGSWANGAGSAAGHGLGGWSLSAVHNYDPFTQTLFFGNGRRRGAQALGNMIQNVAGVGDSGYTGDGGPATAARLYSPNAVVVAANGDLYIANGGRPRISRVDSAGIIATYAGMGSLCSPGTVPACGDGLIADSAKFRLPYGLALGPDGSVYIADFNDARIRKISPTRITSTIAGTGTAGFSFDGHRADSAQINQPSDVAVGPDGSLYIVDQGNSRIRRVAPNGTISTFAGGGSTGFMFGDGGPATGAILIQPSHVAVAPDGTVFIADNGHRKIRKVDLGGTIRTVAGTGTLCSPAFYSTCGDGGPAAAALLNDPQGLTLGLDGSLYYFDAGVSRVRRIDPNGIISAVAGNGDVACSVRSSGPGCVANDGDGGNALQAAFHGAVGLATGPDGTLYVADGTGDEVRKIAPPLPGLQPTDMLIASEDGSVAYLFDESGRHNRTLDTFTGDTLLKIAYDGSGRLQTLTDTYNNVTTIQRDGSGNPTGISAPFGQLTTMTLNGSGYLATVANPGGETVRLYHSSAGLLDSLADPKVAQMHRFFYDSLGRLREDRDPVSSSLLLSLGTKNDTTETVNVTTQMGRVTVHTTTRSANGDLRRMVQDPSGLFSRSTVGLNGTTTTRSPDSTTVTATEIADPRFGMQAPTMQSLSVQLPSGLTSTVLGRRHASLSSAGNPLSLVSETDSVALNNHWTVSTYTAATRRLVQTSPEGRQIFSTLDTKGRVVAAQVAGLDSIRFTYDSHGRLSMEINGGRTTTYTYSGSGGRLASVTDPLSRETQFAYDSAGRLTTQILPNGQLIQFAYDSNGNLTSLTPPGRPAHAFQYTAVDLAKQYDPPTLPIGAKPTKYFYNFDRQVDSIVRPDSVAVAFGYDAGGRPTSIRFVLDTISFGYSGTTGNIASIRRTGGDSLKFRYDGVLLTQVIWKGSLTDSVRAHYNADLRVDSQYVHGGNVVAFGYDNDGLLTQAGGLGLKRSATHGLLLADSLGVSATKAVKTSYAYTSRGELQGLHAARNGTALFGTGYVRDSLGRITQLFDTTQGTAQRLSFIYDSVGRLKADSINGAVFHAFTYDSNGNRLSLTSGGGTTQYWYDAQDRLDSTKVGAGTATKYAYGSNGELKTKVTGASTTTYTYDALGNLTRVVLPSGAQIDYLIDGQNRRVGRKVNGTVTHRWVYQNQLNPVAELDAAGNVVSRFVYGTRTNVPDYIVKGGNTYRIISDHLGSVRLVVDTATGTVAQRIDYDEFGVATVVSGAGFQPFGFAGGVFDDSTSLVRFGLRDYGAMSGRWTAKDPIQFQSGETGLYLYVSNDPLNSIDPTGLQTFQSGVAISGSIHGVGFTFGFGVGIDLHGNIAPFGFYGGGPGAGGRVSGGISLAISNARTICDLAGPFAAGSVGAGDGLGGSVEVFSGPSMDGYVSGGGFTVGAGIGAGGFGGVTNTSIGPVVHLPTVFLP